MLPQSSATCFESVNEVIQVSPCSSRSAAGQVPRVWQRLLPVAYSVFAALLGAQSVLFSKAISLLLRTTIQGDSQLGSWCAADHCADKIF